MRWTPIRYVDDYPPVPHWFTRLMHWRGKPRCRKQGHELPANNLCNVCSHCGEIVAPPPL